MKKGWIVLFAAILITGVFACGGGGDDTSEEEVSEGYSMLEKEADPKDSKGVGPVSELLLDDGIDQKMADAGSVIFEAKCTACHKPTEKHIGPAPQGVLDRRSPEWVMNMILNPEEMVQKDPVAKKLLMEYNGSPMANQNLTEAEARSVLEYFRTL
ncbi:MAG: c-type cytochrome [Saprospiraceae bacterium]